MDTEKNENIVVAKYREVLMTSREICFGSHQNSEMHWRCGPKGNSVLATRYALA